MRLTLCLAAANAVLLASGVVASAALEPAGVSAGVPAPVAAAPQRPAPVAVTPTAVPSAAPSPAPTAVPATPAPVVRAVARTGYRPYATVGPVTLHFPGDVVEAVGLHQSGHDGAQPQSPLDTGARTGLLPSRERGTSPQGAADLVLDPAREVRSPVTGTVLRAGTYTLYCDHLDDYVVVEPDARPGWEVKVLHFQGLRVRAGQRVEAGVTVLGSGPRLLPFASQVDEYTAAPHWPHVHVEVVDPAVADRPSGGSCD